MGFPKAGRISIALAIHSLDRSAHPTYSLDRILQDYRTRYSLA